MAVSTIKAILQKDVRDVWNVVTSVEKYAWRSDLSKTEILNEKQFVEYAKGGYATTFTLTAVIPYERWEFDMENSNMKGHWIGLFASQDGQTEVIFTENVVAKRFLLKPFVKFYLKKQQTRFLTDLRNALSQ